MRRLGYTMPRPPGDYRPYSFCHHVLLEEREGRDLKSLEAWARERGWTKSQAIRAAVRALARRPAEDPLLELSGDVDGLPADLSENFDRYLNETFVAESRAPYRARRRPRTAVRR
jgi:hypothetical protein